MVATHTEVTASSAAQTTQPHQTVLPQLMYSARLTARGSILLPLLATGISMRLLAARVLSGKPPECPT
jgi:hypothetical protein